MAKPARHGEPPEVCPVCGADVPPSARACPECGADEHTGWNPEQTAYDGLDLPGEFSYEQFVRREFGVHPARRRLGRTTWLGLCALLTALALLAWLLL